MRRSVAGPIQVDIALCERLLHQPVDIPPGASFDDEFVDRFRKLLRDQPKRMAAYRSSPISRAAH